MKNDQEFLQTERFPFVRPESSGVASEEDCPRGVMVMLVAVMVMAVGGYLGSLLAFLFSDAAWWAVSAAYIIGATLFGACFFVVRYLRREAAPEI